MIGYVKGILEEADDQCIIVDNHGIGYRIFVPGSVFSGAIQMPCSYTALRQETI